MTHGPSDGTRIHSREKRAYKLCRHIGLLFGQQMDTTCNVVGFENIWIHCPHVFGFVADIIFSTLESGFIQIDLLPNSPDACGRKEYLERKSWELKNIRLRVDWVLLL